MPDTVQRVAAKALIIHNGKVLLLREAVTNPEGTKAGKYMHPGGRVNPGEPFADGLRREIQEETGLDVTIGDPIFVGEWFPVIHEIPHHIVCTFFVCTPKGQPSIRLSEEHDKYLWVGPNDFAQLDIAAPEPLVLEKYFSTQPALS